MAITPTNPSHDRRNDKKFESYNENRLDGGAETCVGQAGAEQFNLEIRTRARKWGIV